MPSTQPISDKMVAKILLVLILQITIGISIGSAQPAYLFKDINLTTNTGEPFYSNPLSPQVLTNSILFFAKGPDDCYGLWMINAATPNLAQPVRSSIYPIATTKMGGKLYFSAMGSADMCELWVSDGTTQGTVPFKILPLKPMGTINQMATTDHLVFFIHDTMDQGKEVWRTDGTSSGTILVKDINPGPEGSQPDLLGELKGKMIFTAYDPVHGNAFWSSDGTPEGTVLVKVIDGTNILSVGAGVECLGKIFVTLPYGPDDYVTWVTDGTASGTVELAPVGNGPMTEFNGKAYFKTYNRRTMQWEVWVTDGTPGGTQPASIITDPFNFDAAVVHNNKLYYFSVAEGQAGLWSTDGVSPQPSFVAPMQNPISEFSPSIGGRFFFAQETAKEGIEPWTSDGTTSGTHLLKDILPGSFSRPTGFFAFDGKCYFVAYDSHGRYWFWSSDGTAEGTQPVLGNPQLGYGSSPTNLTVLNNQLLFQSKYATGASDLYAVNLTNGELNHLLPSPLFTQLSGLGPVVADGKAFYYLEQGDAKGLWATDGTVSGTVLCKAGPMSFSLFAAQEKCFFNANSGIWVSDGTVAGTYKLRDNSFAFPFNDNAYWSVLEPDKKYHLYTGDGITTSTVCISDFDLNWNLLQKFKDKTYAAFKGTLYTIDPATQAAVSVKTLSNDTNTNFLSCQVVGDRLLLIVLTSTTRELWTSDGTADGTVPLKRGLVREGVFYYSLVGQQKQKALFLIDDNVHGNELWGSDGTPEGTGLVKDIRPGIYSSAPHALQLVDGVLYFTANDGEHGDELWRSDGTSEGTRMVRDINPGGHSSNPMYYFPMGQGRFLFQADDGLTGIEFWESDGTAQGTRRLQDLFPGPLSGNPLNFVRAGSNIYFSANDGVHGQELFVLPPNNQVGHAWQNYQ